MIDFGAMTKAERVAYINELSTVDQCLFALAENTGGKAVKVLLNNRIAAIQQTLQEAANEDYKAAKLKSEEVDNFDVVDSATLQEKTA